MWVKETSVLISEDAESQRLQNQGHHVCVTIYFYKIRQ